MKIVNQTADELILKDGNIQGIILGMVFAIFGIVFSFYLNFVVGVNLWIAIGCFVIGLVIIFMTSSILVDINKSNGQIIYQTKRLVGGKTTTYPISNVMGIETRKSWRIERSSNTVQNTMSVPRQVLVSQSVIIFKDGQELPLDHQSSGSTISTMGVSVMMGGPEKEVAMANIVAKFLGVPFQEIMPPNVGMGMNGGISVDGINL